MSTETNEAPRWCWSVNEEEFHGDCATREDAIEEARTDSAGLEGRAGTVFVAPVVHWRKVLERSYFPHVDGFLEDAQQAAADEVGEVADLWDIKISYGFRPSPESVPREQANDLQRRLLDTFCEWMKETGREPRWWGIGEVEAVKVAGEEPKP